MIHPDAFLLLAETWVNGATEAEWRSAVSRAYYAAFHAARQLLRDLGFRVPHGDQAHAYLWLRLSNCGDAGLQMGGSDLNTLRRDRNRADYDLDRDVADADARLQVRTARLILQRLNTARSEPARSQVTDAMRVYERDVLRHVTWAP
jgi:uncharacterized protein (UPF0332 family)